MFTYLCLLVGAFFVSKVDSCKIDEALTRNGTCVNYRYINSTLLFRKCCPPGFSYNSTYHKCDRSQDYFQTYTYFDVGLKDCYPGVITDYKRQSTPEEIAGYNRAILSLPGLQEYFRYGDFCIDKLHGEDGYLFRVCRRNVEVCLKPGVQCIRKCCGDGEIFKDGSFCSPNTSTVNYRGFNRLNVAGNYLNNVKFQ